MTEHRHEWTQSFDNDFVCDECDEQMTFQEALPLLNAAECLTAEDAENLLRWLLSLVDQNAQQVKALRAYAERRK